MNTAVSRKLAFPVAFILALRLLSMHPAEAEAGPGLRRLMKLTLFAVVIGGITQINKLPMFKAPERLITPEIGRTMTQNPGDFAKGITKDMTNDFAPGQQDAFGGFQSKMDSAFADFAKEAEGNRNTGFTSPSTIDSLRQKFNGGGHAKGGSTIHKQRMNNAKAGKFNSKGQAPKGFKMPRGVRGR